MQQSPQPYRLCQARGFAVEQINGPYTRVLTEEGDLVLQIPGALDDVQVSAILDYGRRCHADGERSGAGAVKSSLRRLLGVPSEEYVESITRSLS